MLTVGFMCLLDWFRGEGKGWTTEEIAYVLLGRLHLGGANSEKRGDHQNQKSFMNNSVQAKIPFNKDHQSLLKLHLPLGWGVSL